MVYNFWLNYLISIFLFLQYYFHNNWSYFIKAKTTIFLKFYSIIQIWALIGHLASICKVKSNIQLVISQIINWVLNLGLRVKTIWEYSIYEILLLVKSRLVYLQGFTIFEIISIFAPKWRVIYIDIQKFLPRPLAKILPRNWNKMEKELKILRKKSLVDKLNKQ